MITPSSLTTSPVPAVSKGQMARRTLGAVTLQVAKSGTTHPGVALEPSPWLSLTPAVPSVTSQRRRLRATACDPKPIRKASPECHERKQKGAYLPWQRV